MHCITFWVARDNLVLFEFEFVLTPNQTNLLILEVAGNLLLMFIDKLTALDIMTANPSAIEEDELVVNALEMMRENKITQLPVLKNGDYVGVVHMHDIVKEGII